MTKVPWCTKGQQSQGTVFVATYPGQCTSADQFQSTQVGFIAQLKGKLPPNDTNMAPSLLVIFTIAVCLLHDRLIFCANAQGKTSVQTVCKQMRRQNLPLSLQQQPFCQQCLQTACRATTANTQLLWLLNLDTGLVSPQFHCRYDDFFETISFNKLETIMSSNLQILAGLVRSDKSPTVKQVLQRARPSQPIAHDINLLVPNQTPA
ncbi:hypothetical protein ACHAW6_001927 [Cyclotella cf. meneghiniana]